MSELAARQPGYVLWTYDVRKIQATALFLNPGKSGVVRARWKWSAARGGAALRGKIKKQMAFRLKPQELRVGVLVQAIRH